MALPPPLSAFLEGDVSGKVWSTRSMGRIYPKSLFGFTTYCVNSPTPIYWCIVLHVYSLCTNKLAYCILRVNDKVNYKFKLDVGGSEKQKFNYRDLMFDIAVESRLPDTPQQRDTHDVIGNSGSPDYPSIHFTIKQPLNSRHPTTLYNGQFSWSQLYANNT